MSASQGSPASALGSSQAGASTPGLEVKVRKAVAELLPNVDLNQVSVYKFRCMLARHLGLGKKGLEDTAEDVNTWIQDAVVFKAQLSTQTAAQRMAAIVEDLGQELSSQKSVAHFLTLSRVLPETLAATDLRQEFKRGSDSRRTKVRNRLNSHIFHTCAHVYKQKHISASGTPPPPLSMLMIFGFAVANFCPRNDCTTRPPIARQH